MWYMQVTGIFGSSMEVYICVDGESPGNMAAPVASDSSGHGTGSAHINGNSSAPSVFHCGSAFATVSGVLVPLQSGPCRILLLAHHQPMLGVPAYLCR